MNHEINDTIVAIATPPGAGALGVIRVSGSRAIEKTNAIFKGKDLTQQLGFTLHYGHILQREVVIDEVLLSLFKGPKSFTGEDVIEISCHGSSYILNQVLELLLKQGTRLAKPGEFTQRAFLNGKMDLSQAEAVADLIASDSEASHKLAMQQMKGGFKKRIDHLRERLISFASLLELELDFGEEDVEFAQRPELRILVLEVKGVVEELVNSFKLGNVFKNGVYTVIAGRPNAGKSTLLNALLNEERAIVSDIAGTTRDTIEATLNIKGLIFRLVDTAGIREASDQIEILGVQRTLESVERSSLLVYVYDAHELSQQEVEEDLRKLVKNEMAVLVIANKTDLLADETVVPASHQKISAKLHSTASTAVIKEALFDIALRDNRTKDDIVVSNLRHVEALQHTLGALNRVLDGLDSGLSGDLLAFEMRQALHYLGVITGEVTTDDLLENIFRNFCIGK
jgi:tRNA modification GTPase